MLFMAVYLLSSTTEIEASQWSLCSGNKIRENGVSAQLLLSHWDRLLHLWMGLDRERYLWDSWIVVDTLLTT